MEDIDLVSSGAISRKDNTILFTCKEEKLFFPIENVDAIFVFGEVSTNKRFLEYLNKYDIPIYFYSRYNKYIGSFFPNADVSGTMTLKQCEAYLDNDKRLLIAKEIVKYSSKNIVVNLRYYDHKLFSEHIKRICRLEDLLNNQNTIEKILSFEGRIRQIYYSAFDEIIKNKEFVFDKRKYYPPDNEVNALISLLNSLLYNIVKSVIVELKLNASISYLHSSGRRYNSLQLDISEIYKPILVDRLIFRLLNKRQLRKEHFINKISLSKEGLYIVLREFNKMLKKTIKVKTKKYTPITLIKMDVIKLKKHLIGKSVLTFFVKSDK